MNDWRDISTAPKNIVSRKKSLFGNTYAEHGPYILGYPVLGGGVARVRWWQSSDWQKPGNERFRNFLEDGGNAAHPTHWMPLPEPPE